MYSIIVFSVKNESNSSQVDNKSELIKLRFFENKNKMIDFFVKLYGIDKLNINSDKISINQFTFFINNHINIGFSESKSCSPQCYYVFIFGDDSIQHHNFKKINPRYYDQIHFKSNESIYSL